MPLNLILTLTLFLSGAITGLISLYAFSRRTTAPTLPFALFMAALSVYSIGYGFEITNDTLDGMLFWIRVEYLGVSFIPALFIIAASRFAGETRWLTRPVLLALFIIPVGTLVLNHTNGHHHLFYRSVEVGTAGPFPVLLLGKGPWYWVHMAYTNISLLAGNVLFLLMIVRKSHLFRKQAVIMLIGSLVPWATLLLYLTGMSPMGLDINPFMFSITGIILSSGIFRYRFIDILPIARDVIFDNMTDGFLVIDMTDRIVDVNPAARKMLGITSGAIGMNADRFVRNWKTNGSAPAGTDGPELALEPVPGKELDVRSFPVTGRRGRFAGHIISVRDITEEKRLELIIKNNEKRLKEEIARVRRIQLGLTPRMDLLADYDIAGAFLPAADLSGDFFDAFFIDENIFQIILCDVMDHGVASSYIGMQIRSMFRAISAPGMRPSDIIRGVNMRMADDLKTVSYFASAAVCHINTETDEVVYSSAGHPPSLLYDARNNRIEKIGSTGTLIGLFRDVRHRDLSFALREGDCLLMLTDGSYEARNRATGAMYGMDALTGEYLSNIPYSSKDIITSIIARIFDHIDYEMIDDDITMICVRKRSGSVNPP